MSRTRSKFEEHWCGLYDDIIDDEDHEELPSEINGQHNLVHTPDVEVDNDVSLNYGVSKYQHRAHHEKELAQGMRRAVNRGGSDNEFVENLEHIREWALPEGAFNKIQEIELEDIDE